MVQSRTGRFLKYGGGGGGEEINLYHTQLINELKFDAIISQPKQIASV